MPKKSAKKLPTELKFKKLVEHMNEGVWMGDKEERTIYANPKFCQMTGYALEEMIGKKSYDFWDEESAKRVKNVNTGDRKKGVSSSYEGNLVRRDGHKVPVLLSGTPLPDGGTIGIMTDLSELKKKEEKEHILSKAIQYATDAIITFNSKGLIESWNKGAKIIFGYKNEEIVGDKLSKIFTSREMEKILADSAIRYNLELSARHKNKESIKISATLTPVFMGENKPVLFYLIIARDITGQAKLEEELGLKYKKIKEAYNKFGIIRREMDYIFDLLSIQEEYNDQKQIADFIVTSIIMLTKIDGCVLRIYNSNKNTLDLLSSFGLGADWQGKSSLKYPNSLVEKAFKMETPLKIIDIAKEPKYQSKYLAKKSNLSSLLLIPLKSKGKLIGSLSLYCSPEKKLEIFENEFIEKYAKLIEIVLANQILKA